LGEILKPPTIKEKSPREEIKGISPQKKGGPKVSPGFTLWGINPFPWTPGLFPGGLKHVDLKGSPCCDKNFGSHSTLVRDLRYPKSMAWKRKTKGTKS